MRAPSQERRSNGPRRVLNKTAAFLVATFAATAAVAQPQTGADVPSQPAEATTGTADETAVDPSRAQAREAFRLGSTLARQGQWSDALASFERSSELHPHPVTTYNLGYVERALGHLTRARKYLQLALEQESAGQSAHRAATANKAGERLPEDLAALARGYLVEVQQKLVRTVVLVESSDVAIAIDGRPLEVVPVAPGSRPLLIAGTLPAGPAQRAPSTTFDLLIDAGSHVVLVSIKGKPDAVLTRVFQQGSAETLRLPGAAAREPVPPPQEPKPEPKLQPAAPPSEEGPGLAPWMWTAFGLGAVGIVTGSVFGILALDLESNLQNTCRSMTNCPEGSQDDIDRLGTYATVSDIAFIVGGAGIGTGAVLWFLDDRGSSKEGATVTVQGGARSGRVSVTGRF